MRQGDILAVHPDYFQLTGGLERWLYRLARKSVPDKAEPPAIRFKMETLHERSGVTRDLKLFAFDIRKIAETQPLPEYGIQMEYRKGRASSSPSTATRTSRAVRGAVAGWYGPGAQAEPAVAVDAYLGAEDVFVAGPALPSVTADQLGGLVRELVGETGPPPEPDSLPALRVGIKSSATEDGAQRQMDVAGSSPTALSDFDLERRRHRQAAPVAKDAGIDVTQRGLAKP